MHDVKDIFELLNSHSTILPKFGSKESLNLNLTVLMLHERLELSEASIKMSNDTDLNSKQQQLDRKFL
jgi:hypothetical protein